MTDLTNAPLAAFLAQAHNSAMALADLLRTQGWKMCTAESCTGGMIGAACIDLAGSSDWFDRGWITYSNTAKVEELNVPLRDIRTHGAVSEVVARAMVSGAVTRASLPVGVAVTGVAGPGGGSADKPVGTVWFAWSVNGQVHAECQRFEGDRSAVRHATLAHALHVLCERVAAA